MLLFVSVVKDFFFSPLLFFFFFFSFFLFFFSFFFLTVGYVKPDLHVKDPQGKKKKYNPLVLNEIQRAGMLHALWEHSTLSTSQVA